MSETVCGRRGCCILQQPLLFLTVIFLCASVFLCACGSTKKLKGLCFRLLPLDYPLFDTKEPTNPEIIARF